jgi:hypothetical protein
MPQGYVTTARGEVINIDELKRSASKALNPVVQPGSEIKRKTVSKRKPLNMRGHVPAQGKAAAPKVPESLARKADEHTNIPNPAIDNRPVKSGYAEDGEARTLADLTGVKVDQREYVKRKGGQVQRGPVDQLEQQANEALGDILQDLAEANPNREVMEEVERREAAAVTKATRKKATRKKAASDE